MPDNTKKECRCGHLDDSHIYNDFGLGHCMLCMCERFSSIDKNKEEVCPCGGKRVEGKCTRPVVNLEPPLSDDWINEFDQKFNWFKGVKITVNYGEDFERAKKLQDYYRNTGEELKDFIRQQRIQAQRELAEEWSEIIHKRKQEWHKTCLTDEFTNGRFWEAQEIWEILNARGLLSNNKE